MTRSITFVAAAALAAALLLPAGAEAGQQQTTLTVTKVVEGDVPADAAFVINVECTLTDVGDLNFGAEGGSQTINVVPDEDCAVTETDDGGAESVTYAASMEIDGCTAAADSDTGATFSFFNGGAACTATVTNTFPEPVPEPEPAAEVVEVVPTFTG